MQAVRMLAFILLSGDLKHCAQFKILLMSTSGATEKMPRERHLEVGGRRVMEGGNETGVFEAGVFSADQLKL